MAKPIPEQLYRKYIKMLGLQLEKGGIDYSLCEGKQYLCTIKIMHSKGKKWEVAPDSI